MITLAGYIILILASIVGISFVLLIYAITPKCPKCRNTSFYQTDEDPYDGIIYCRCKKCKEIFTMRND